MNCAPFEELLERKMGLKAASIGTSAIARAVGARLRARGLDDVGDYWELVQRSGDELQALIEAVVVPETWFFRDPHAFEAMVRAIVEQRSRDMARTFRLLSIPCSTGEEPYTMAMALIDAGVPADRFSIDAVDISNASLALAQLGVYGRNSFRSRDLGFRDRHFERAERDYRLTGAARAPVRFAQGNILDGDFLLGRASYDIIFCRNLLIYFDVPTQDRAIAVLKRLLVPDGMLFVGHSEASLVPGHGFVSARIPMAFGFRKAAPAAHVKKVEPVKRVASPRPAPVRLPPAPRAAPRRPVLSPAFQRDPVLAMQRPGIDELRRIADGGRLDEAARGCEAHIRECGPSPDALLLLGLISDAAGDPSAAARYYRKALYLEPAHAEALDHLALLLKRQGDHAGAKLLHDRIRRQGERRAG